MNALLGGAATGVLAAIAADRAVPGDFRGRDAGTTAELVRALLRKKRDFGITRLGSLTRLDRAGVCVAQAVRPLSLSNAVAQGKGTTLLDAAASALMEALETWAGENIPVERTTTAQARHLGEDIRSLYAGCLVHTFDAGWDRLPLAWIDGYDLLGGRIVPVPAALVDTVYTLPSPHPVAFPRTTTGLAAGRTMLAAFIHATLEVLERAAVTAAERHPRFFEECQVNVEDVDMPASSRILADLRAVDLKAGIWLVPGEHGLPTFHCHVIEGENHRELAPLPGEGFGCDFTHDRALAKALLEAAQARVTAISGTREDITRSSYPDRYERDSLAEWRKKLAAPRRTLALPRDGDEPTSGAAALDLLLRALQKAGAKAALVVSLFSARDPELEVIRVVAPPLRPGRGPDRMADDIVVFLGPTLRHAEALTFLEARYLPPAEQGSFVRTVREHRPKAIALIDGVFGKTPAVRHKEILWTLTQGIPVFGAASVGALRAAELSEVGMRGHGFIYRWYSLTPLADDDEVAVAMTPPELGAEPLSEALINIRLTLRRAARSSIVPGDLRRALEEIACATHFVDRSYAQLLDHARSTLPPRSHAALDRLAEWLPANAIDQKRADAVALLTRLDADPSLLDRRPAAVPFRMTEAWAYDLDAAGLWPGDFSVRERTQPAR